MNQGNGGRTFIDHVQSQERLATYYKILANQRDILTTLDLLLSHPDDLDADLRFKTIAALQSVGLEAIQVIEMIWVLSGPPDKP